MKLMFLGPPGAGKGTQAKMTCERYGIVHISTGDMLRAEMKSGSALGQKAKAVIDAGELVSDEIIVAMVESRLKQDDCKNGFLLDGVPRTLAQADAMESFVQLDAVVDIEVPSKFLVDRICTRRVCTACGAVYSVKHLSGKTCEKCGGELVQRADDTEETVMNRIAVYEAQTKPLVEYYEKKGIVKYIDGTGSIEAVFEGIKKALDS
ncbi:MAG: adenylate kinase [Eubacteriales bacterium]